MRGLTSHVLNEDMHRITRLRDSRDVVAHVVDARSMPEPPAPAWYVPARGDLFVHTTAAEVDAVDKDWDVRAIYTDRDMARVAGLVVHETAHSRWSGWMTTAAIPSILAPIVTMLEELRIEKRAVDHEPMTRKLLRASFGLLLGDVEESMSAPTKLIASHNWALLVGRSYAGVASPSEVEAVDIAARTLLGDETVDLLVDLLQEAIESSGSRLIPIAREWVEIVGLDGYELIVVGCGHSDSHDDDGTPTAATPGGSTPPPPSDDDDDEDDDPTDGSEFGDADGDSSYGSMDSVDGKPGADDDAITEEDGAIMSDAAVKARETVLREWRKDPAVDIANPNATAAKVFGDRSGKQKSRSWTKRKATSEERRDVTRASRALEAMVLPAISKTKAGGQLPPGRLRTREAVRASADRSAGRMTDAKMWTTTKRRHSDAKPVIVGIATDTSGSMKWAEKAVAQFAYVMSNAGSRIGARTAAVTFGNEVEAVTWPGEPAREVIQRAANGGQEEFDGAMAALDGALKLSHPNGAAKLLLIISDGHLVKSMEMARATRWMSILDAAGVKVIWLTDGDTAHIRSVAPKAQVVRVNPHSGGDIGKALLDEAIAAIGKMEGH